jgi:hypothetical protein
VAAAVPSAAAVTAAPTPGPSAPEPKGDVRRNVSIGGAAVSGGTVSNAARVVAGLRKGLRDCYTRETSEATGSIRFTITVGASGAVTNVKAQRGGDLSSNLVACSTAFVGGAKFDAPQGGAATIQVPTTFRIDRSAERVRTTL